jgi:hypothetical protein
MNDETNPFIRGYQALSIRRLLIVSYDDECPLTYLPLHSSQAHLTDLEVTPQPCMFCEDFVFLARGRPIPDDIDERRLSFGLARGVIYAVMAHEFGKPLHIGDTYSREAAEEVVKRLTFATGHYSRCWEISSGHVHAGTREYLESLTDAPTFTGLLFEAFRVPDAHAVGVKLISTPWTDDNLRAIEDRTASALHREQVEAYVPEDLIELLHLAAAADVRFLIFDPDAPTVEGLPLYKDG